MTDVELLKKEEIDANKNDKIDIQEMEDFLESEENIKKLGEAMDSTISPELLQELESVLKDLCEKLLSQPELSENQQKIINYFLNNFGDKYPELKEKIENKTNGNQEIIEDPYIDITSIQQEIDNEIDKMIRSIPLNNLQDLGIDVSLQYNKKSKGIIWENVINNIKKPEDINKINEDTIKQYLSLPDNIPEENYGAIAENLKLILYKHLQLHPKWKTIIGNKGDYSSGMSLKDTRENDTYETNLHKQIEKLQKKPLNQQIDLVVKKLPDNSDLLDLWLKTILNSKKYKNKQETILKNLFDKIPVEQSDKFFRTCEKNSFINELKDNYVKYRLDKNNNIDTDNKTYCFLRWKNKANFEKFYGKGIKLSNELSFDELYQKTKNFYEGLKVYKISPRIPIPKILEFYNSIKNLQSRVEQAKKKHEQTVNKGNKFAAAHPVINALAGVGAAPGYSTGGGSFSSNLETQSKRDFDSKKAALLVEMANAYAKLLLNDPSMRGKKITAPKEFGGFTLDFSKTTPEAVVRDSFRENLEDQRNLFLYNIKNDRQAAFGSFLGMVGGIAGSATVAIFTGNIRATSAGFTAGLRLGNGIGQEIWNSGEFLYEQATGNKINDGNNGVESFGQGFLRGVGILDQNYEYVGTAKFLSGLLFDYASTVATFGLSQKFGGFLQNLEGVKFAGGALKFGMEELILENFLVDIPMNIIQTGFETFTGIDDGVTIGNTAIGNQRTIEGQGGYKSGSLNDMLRAMKDATEQNLSFENLSQTFFNTVIYGGFLEGGGAAIKKMKGYLPAGQVSNFTERSAVAATAFAGLTNFMSAKQITFNKDGKCIDTKTKQEIAEIDPRFQELCTHLKAVNATKAGVIESFETLIETQKQMVADPENKTGLLFRLGLISPTNTPLNILRKKKELVKKKLNEAQKKGDNNRVNQLQKLLDIYNDAEIKLTGVRRCIDGETRELTQLRNIEESEFQNISDETLTEMGNDLRNTFGSTNYDSFDLYLHLIRNKKPGETLSDSFRTLDLSRIDTSRGTICTGMARLLQATLSQKGIKSHMIRFKAGGTKNNEYLGDGHTALIAPKIMEDGSHGYVLLDPGLLISQPLSFSKGKSTSVNINGTIHRIKYTGDTEYPFMMQIEKPGKKPKDLYFNPDQERINPEQTLNTEILRVFTDFKIAKQDSDGNNLGLIRLTLDENPKIDIRWRKRFTDEELENIKDSPRYGEFLKVCETLGCDPNIEYTEKTLQDKGFSFSIDEFKRIKDSPRYEDFKKTCDVLGRDPDVMYDELMLGIENLDEYTSTIQNISSAK